MAFSDALAPSSADEKLLLKASSDTNIQPSLFDSDGSEHSPPLQASGRDDTEDVMLLDTGDEASFLQVPCLIPESVMPSSSSLSQNDGQQKSSTFSSSIAVDGSMDVRCASPVAVAADIPNGSLEKSVESQPFGFVNDVMKSCGPKLSNKSAILGSVPTVRGDKLAAAEFGSSKS